jgi:hypothetical protein
MNDGAGAVTSHPDEDVPETDAPPDMLKPADRQEAAVLVELFGEDSVARIFSKSNWMVRFHGIHRLADGICELASGYLEAFKCFCYICRHRMKENQKQLVIAVLNDVRRIAETHQIEPPELTQGIAHLLPSATAKIGGSQEAVTAAVPRKAS